MLDISIKSDSFHATLAGSTRSIYQNSHVPMSFTATLVFSGARLSGTSQLLTNFEFYLSDQKDLTPATLNNKAPLLITDVSKTQLSEATRSALSGDLTDEKAYPVSGQTEVYVAAASCASTSRFLCVRYKMLVDTVPAFRDGQPSNDFQCTDISALLKCTDGKDFFSLSKTGRMRK